MTHHEKLRGTEATRVELLDIGLELVLERGLPVGVNIRVAEVVERAGRTLGSAYQIWDNQEHFREDVAIHLARSAGHASSAAVMPDILASIERGDSLHEMVRSVGATFFRSLIDSPHFFVSRHFWTIAQPLPPEIREALADTALAIQKDFEGFFAMILDHFELQLSHGYELQNIVRMMIAVVEGLALESRFPTKHEDNNSHTNLFVDTMLLFADRCTEPSSS